MNVLLYPDLMPQLTLRLTQEMPSKETLITIFPNIKSIPTEIPNTARLSAVMVLLFIKNNEWYVLAIRRAEDGGLHSGQIGFPGGRHEHQDANMEATALRETFEEIGISPNQINVIGALSPIYVLVSNFNVFPFIGIIESPKDLSINKGEVQSVIEIKLSDLFSPSNKIISEVSSPAFPEKKRKVNSYTLKENVVIWGATALIMAELEVLLLSKSDN